MKCNQSRPGFELVSPCPFPTTITITPRAPPIDITVPTVNNVSFNKISKFTDIEIKKEMWPLSTTIVQVIVGTLVMIKT